MPTVFFLLIKFIHIQFFCFFFKQTRTKLFKLNYEAQYSRMKTQKENTIYLNKQIQFEENKCYEFSF
jgi:hypothetical protein